MIPASCCGLPRRTHHVVVLPPVMATFIKATTAVADLFWRLAPPTGRPGTWPGRLASGAAIASTCGVEKQILADLSSRTAGRFSAGKPAAKLAFSFRKEVIQPQVPLRLPCYDLVPIAEFILGAWLLAVTSATSDAPHFRGLTGGVYKAQEHIHRGMLTRDY
jgi:hypothetical protein